MVSRKAALTDRTVEVEEAQEAEAGKVNTVAVVLAVDAENIVVEEVVAVAVANAVAMVITVESVETDAIIATNVKPLEV